jgi:dTDP-4-dehydrorhamnose reductase
MDRKRLGAVTKQKPCLVVFGAAGMIGRALTTQRPLPGWDLISFGREDVDITDLASVKRALATVDTGVVVNSAAYTAVDLAESDRDTAWAVNVDGAGNVARAAAEQGLVLVHLSSDYVFDGHGHCPYAEEDATAPQSTYGLTKLAGEQVVKAEGSRHLIIRTSWVFAPWGENFVRTIMALIAERNELSVVNDQVGCPTSACDLAGVIHILAHRLVNASDPALFGILHVAGDVPVSWYDFASAIIAALGRNTITVHPVASNIFPRPAPRPTYSALDCSKLMRLHGLPPPSWRRGLSHCLREEKMDKIKPPLW